MIAKKFLCVDGDFFCHRTLHGMRMNNKEITLDKSSEIINFNKALINSVHSLFNVFCNDHHSLIDQIIFVFDHKSWRKSIIPLRPYYLVEEDTEIPIGYKDNRKSMKEESDINYDNFSLCEEDFRKTLDTANLFPSYWFEGAEGDDLMIMLKRKLLQQNPDHKMIVFCTDGDLKMLLHKDEELKQQSDSILLFRNIKSGAAPEGEFVITNELYENLYGKRDSLGKEDIMDAFIRATTNGTDENYFKNLLFNINFKDQSGRANQSRTPGAGISIATPTLTLFTKMIIGDKKDNIFPIFRWKTKTGSIRNVTENMLISAFKELDLTYNEDSACKIYSDKTTLTKLLYSLRDIVKQENVDIQLIGKHFVHNRKILDIRTIDKIPVDIVEKFEIQFNKSVENGLLEKSIARADLSNLKQDHTDSTSILSTSLPDLPDELKSFSDLL